MNVAFVYGIKNYFRDIPSPAAFDMKFNALVNTETIEITKIFKLVFICFGNQPISFLFLSFFFFFRFPFMLSNLLLCS